METGGKAVEFLKANQNSLLLIPVLALGFFMIGAYMQFTAINHGDTGTTNVDNSITTSFSLMPLVIIGGVFAAVHLFVGAFPNQYFVMYILTCVSLILSIFALNSSITSVTVQRV